MDDILPDRRQGRKKSTYVPSDPRKAAFRRRLRYLMSLQGLTSQNVADRLGIGRATVASWYSGRTIPRGTMPRRLADVLDAEDLVALAADVRMKTCIQCHAIFEAQSKLSVARFCGTECRTHWWHQTRNDDRAKVRHDEVQKVRAAIKHIQREVARVKAERYDLALGIRTMCWACEWDGICKDATCPLRSVSPLKLQETKLKVVNE
jgi:hypothetical protein